MSSRALLANEFRERICMYSLCGVMLDLQTKKQLSMAG